MMPTPARHITIYEVQFASGHFYIGQTSMPLLDRLYGHRQAARHPHRRGTNRRMKALLDAGVQARIFGVAHFTDQAVADWVETKRIHHARTTQPDRCLNAQAGPLGHLDPPSRAQQTREVGKAVRCSWCRRTLPPTDYYADASRSSGLASRCRDCHGTKDRLMSHAAYNGTCTAAAYAKAKRLCTKPGYHDR